MSFYKNFGTHKVVEMNQSTGLRTGHMVAQTPFMKGELEGDSLDNGYILALDFGKNELRLAKNTDPVLYIHFTEEYMPYSSELKHFSVPYIGEEDAKYCYPRAIAIYTNDAWTTDNFTGELNADGVSWAQVTDGQLAVVKTEPASGHVFLVENDTLPDAVTPAARFIYLGVKAGA